MSKASDDFCKILLDIIRKELGAKPEERIDKRYYTSLDNGDREYLAPDNMYYRAHCGYCAEIKYLEHIYNDSKAC